MKKLSVKCLIGISTLLKVGINNTKTPIKKDFLVSGTFTVTSNMLLKNYKNNPMPTLTISFAAQS